MMAIITANVKGFPEQSYQRSCLGCGQQCYVRELPSAVGNILHDLSVVQ